MSKLNFSYLVSSDIGLRNDNQDFYYCDYPYRTGDKGSGISSLSVIADGMGGLSHGREVAEIAVNSFIEYIFHQNFKDTVDSKLVLNYMDQGFTLANEKVIQFAKKNNTKSGTTLTAALLINDNLYITHVGDTRAYIFHNKKLFTGYSMSQITSDDHPPNNPFSLVNYIGDKNKELVTSRHEMKVKSGSLIILTSDGFHGPVKNERFLKLVNKNKFELLPESLIKEAKISGKDNITVAITKTD